MAKELSIITTKEVESKMIPLRGQMVLLDRDVAELYGVETREINQAVKNNPNKFPKGYIIETTDEESSVLRSKISTLEEKTGKPLHPVNRDRDRTQLHCGEDKAQDNT